MVIALHFKDGSGNKERCDVEEQAEAKVQVLKAKAAAARARASYDRGIKARLKHLL